MNGSGFFAWSNRVNELMSRKQVLKKFGIAELQKVIALFYAASDAVKKEIRSCHKTLMSNAYAGGSKCHAVYMVVNV